MNFYIKYFLFLFPFWFFTQNGNNSSTLNIKEIKHNISVHHPGNGKDNIESAQLVEVQNKKGQPIHYYMNVESVICLESVCKVVPVRIFWDNLGNYKRYTLKKGVTLEKYEADVFEEQDYVKLHSILSNTNSPFKNVAIDEILTVPDETHNDIDAVSGATALELDEKDTVPGAALTCYTLWHWTYGDIQQIIRDLTGQSLNSKEFKTYIKSNEVALKLFAVEQLNNTLNFKNKLVDVVVSEAILEAKLVKPTISYLENAPNHIYFKALLKMFKNGKQQEKIVVLNSLFKTKKEAPNNYFDDLSKQIGILKSYQEVSIFLRLMKIKNPQSEVVNKNVFPLLERDFIIARNAYWFLKNQDLSDQEIEKLNKFQQKHKDQL